MSTTEERFWSKVNKDGPTMAHMDTPCWVWVGPAHNRGYGVFGHDGRRSLTHRASWRICTGDIPSGMWVLHRCDNKRCVRPDHLYLGTVKENVADAVARGRLCRGDDNRAATAGKRATGDRHFLRRHPERRAYGEANPGAKLTAVCVETMRAEVARGASVTEVAARAGVAMQTAWLAVTGRTWRTAGGVIATDYRRPHHHPRRGSEYPLARLTEATVAEARARHAAGERCASLAEEFGVTRSCMHLALHRKTWGHVP